jgi:hypothetical protein
MKTGRRRLLILATPLMGLACLDDLKAVGPGEELTIPLTSVQAEPGDDTAVFAQVLDVNGEGVDGACVTFVRTDESRIVWIDGAVGSDSVSVKTKRSNADGIVGKGVARAALSVPDTAEPGDAAIVAVLKHPADNDANITQRLTFTVVAKSTDGGTGGDAGAPGAAGSGGSVAGGGSSS